MSDAWLRRLLRKALGRRFSMARRAGRSYRLLASARGGQHFVKSCIGAEFSQQWIGEQIAMRAIALFDRALEQMKSRLFLAAEREKRSLVIPRLRVGLGGQAGFRFLRHPVQVRSGPQLQASF